MDSADRVGLAAEHDVEGLLGRDETETRVEQQARRPRQRRDPNRRGRPTGTEVAQHPEERCGLAVSELGHPGEGFGRSGQPLDPGDTARGRAAQVPGRPAHVRG